MPKTNSARMNHAEASPPRVRRGRGAKAAADEPAKQDKVARNRQHRSDHATSKPSKQQLYLELLSRPDGAGIEEPQAATGWQAHKRARVLVGHGQEEARADAQLGSGGLWPPALPGRAGGSGITSLISPAASPRSAHQPSPATTCISAVAAQLAALPNLSIAELRAAWRRRFRSPPPNRLSRDLLMRGIAYKIQERAHGGLGRATMRKLEAFAEQLAAGDGRWLDPYPAFKPGTRLVRSWGGETHSVLVLAEGFEYRGAHFRSLSQIARTITRVRWSGPRFFGLKCRSKPFARRVEADHG